MEHGPRACAPFEVRPDALWEELGWWGGEKKKFRCDAEFPKFHRTRSRGRYLIGTGLGWELLKSDRI